MAICGFSTRSWQVCVIWVVKNHKKLLKSLSQSSFSEIKIRCLFSLGWFFHPVEGKALFVFLFSGVLAVQCLCCEVLGLLIAALLSAEAKDLH